VATAALAALSLSALAQSETKPQDLERAQKQADAVFKWIKVHNDKPAAAPAPAPAAKPAPAPAPVAVAKKPTPAPAPVTARAPAEAPAASEPQAPVVAEAPPASGPEIGAPVVVAAAPPSVAPSPAVQAAVQATAAPAAPEPEVDMPLHLVSKVEPAIPRPLLKTLTTGSAQVKFTVEPDGRVSQAVATSASHVRLGAAAVEAIKQWRFAPIKHAQEAAVEVSFNNPPVDGAAATASA
jgi:TonB family protein